MRETIECAHELCNCEIDSEIEAEEYCSQTCKDDAENGIESEACNCGHPQCDVP